MASSEYEKTNQKFLLWSILYITIWEIFVSSIKIQYFKLDSHHCVFAVITIHCMNYNLGYVCPKFYYCTFWINCYNVWLCTNTLHAKSFKISSTGRDLRAHLLHILNLKAHLTHFWWVYNVIQLSYKQI